MSWKRYTVVLDQIAKSLARLIESSQTRASVLRRPGSLRKGLMILICGLLVSAWTDTASARSVSKEVSPRLEYRPPLVLSETDTLLYQRIFAVQQTGQWREADKLINRVRNKVLMGHVLAQRYLHPTKYRSRYVELRDWMKHYADHHEARRIYRLALRRKPAKTRSPRKPVGGVYPVYRSITVIEQSGYWPENRTAQRILKEVASRVKRDRLTVSMRYISTRENRRILGQQGFDRARNIIAAGWFYYGKSEKALSIAEAAIAKSGHVLPYARWIAGLAAFRLGKYEISARHFEAMAKFQELSSWDRAAAGFWSARANMKSGRPERVNRFLRLAAAEPQTFYGILARRWLGDHSPFDWQPRTVARSQLVRLASKPEGRRALALVHVRQYDLADRELRVLVSRNDSSLMQALVAVASSHSLPSAALKAGVSFPDDPGRLRVDALYPVPPWSPQGGFRVDRALLFAIMRQESGFRTRARSHMGAMGLMQLMPATASFISQRRYDRRARYRLYEPATNLYLGQKYVLYLLENEDINGDILRLTAAYNGGPGNLRKWLQKSKNLGFNYDDDPLMFIESIPLRETRNFVERVLAGMWLYRERFGQQAPSLDALAEGKPPIYVSVDPKKKSLARNVRN